MKRNGCKFGITWALSVDLSFIVYDANYNYTYVFYNCELYDVCNLCGAKCPNLRNRKRSSETDENLGSHLYNG